jgi:hypothetical protein
MGELRLLLGREFIVQKEQGEDLIQQLQTRLIQM